MAEREIICACVNLNRAAYKSFLAANPAATFEEVLAMTKAGATCTACLLDLEYHFVTASRQRPTAARQANLPDVDRDQRGLKRRLFDFIDKWSPMVPFKLIERLPVICGADVEQRLWVSNRSLLFAGNRAAPPYNLEVTIRDAVGTVLHTLRHTVEPDASFEFPVSGYLSPAHEAGDLTVGSMEIRRSSAFSGVRGTTRPQTEILAPNGACSVHAQAYKTPGEKWFSIYHRPADQRIFLSYISFKHAPIEIDLTYPMNAKDLGIEPSRHRLTIAPFGAVLHEICLTPEAAEMLDTRDMILRWTSDGEYNCHVFCATPDLSRLSIDHS